MATNLIFYGFGEEIGWRGLLQPTLQRRHSALTAAVLVAVVWAGWHLPLFGITATYRTMPAVGFVGFALSLLVGALVLAWLHLRAAGAASWWSRPSTPSSTLPRPPHDHHPDPDPDGGGGHRGRPGHDPVPGPGGSHRVDRGAARFQPCDGHPER